MKTSGILKINKIKWISLFFMKCRRLILMMSIRLLISPHSVVMSALKIGIWLESNRLLSLAFHHVFEHGEKKRKKKIPNSSCTAILILSLACVVFFRCRKMCCMKSCAVVVWMNFIKKKNVSSSGSAENEKMKFLVFLWILSWILVSAVVRTTNAN